MFQKVKGFKDIYGSEIKYWEKAEKIFKNICRNYGYEEFRLPILEKVEVFSRGIGAATDIVEKEMFIFDDRSGDKLALRPEGTASLVRGFIENKLYSNNSINKYFYTGPMFRRERPQKGRFRQFHQAGIEVFGSPSPLLDADVINLLNEIFIQCGLTDDVTLEINSIGCPECRPMYKEKLITFFEEIKDNLCEDCNRRLYKNPMRILDCKVDKCKSSIVNAPLIYNYLCDSCKKHDEEFQTYLSMMKINYKSNPFMVRGLDYYVRSAFEIVTDKLGASSAVGAGGRYDGLVKTLGGPDLPGIGFAIGLDRLTTLMMEKDNNTLLSDKKIYIVVQNETLLKYALSMLNDLRKKNISTEIDYDKSSLKSQFKKADKSNALYSIIIAENEFNDGQVAVKNMKDSSQEMINFDKIINYIVDMNQ